jgi:hypothetical protein
VRRAALVLSASALACFPQFEDTPWLVTEPRLLAVRGEPAEAEPLQQVRFSALVAAPDEVSLPLEWAFCLEPRTLAERNGVAPECLASEGDAIVPLPAAMGEIPVDACARFGPNPPPSEPDQPPLRPADPDLTGGYHLPVRATLAGEVAFGFERLRCGLAGAPREIFAEYQQRYAVNQHPTIEVVELVGLGVMLGADTSVPVGAEIVLRVRTSTTSREPYVQYDPVRGVLIERVETLVLSWFSSRGTFAAARTDGEENTWIAPLEPSVTKMWFVLRDARGGVDWLEREMRVE